MIRLLHSAPLVIVLGCGIPASRFVEYPKPTLATPPEAVDEHCPIGLSAFSFHINPMIEARCLESCHEPGGSGEGGLVLHSGEADFNREKLRFEEDATAEGIFRKASGLIPHGGGVAAIGDDKKRLETWFLAETLCVLE